MGWSAQHKWVSRSLARDEWIARTSDEQIVSNVTACKLALVTRAHDFLTSTDSAVFLRGARAFTLQYPPIQRVEDGSERIERTDKFGGIMAERTVLLDATEAVIGAHQEPPGVIAARP